MTQEWTFSDSHWTFSDFQEGRAHWITSNGNPVSVIPADYNGVDAAFLVVEIFISGGPGTTKDWLDEVRQMYADTGDDDDKYMNYDDYVYKQMIAWGGNECMRWALF